LPSFEEKAVFEVDFVLRCQIQFLRLYFELFSFSFLVFWRDEQIHHSPASHIFNEFYLINRYRIQQKEDALCYLSLSEALLHSSSACLYYHGED
jgi:hypothetical protein